MFPFEAANPPNTGYDPAVNDSRPINPSENLPVEDRRWPEIQSILRDRFGHDQLLPAQKKVIDRLLSGQNVLAVLPTGHGKSLCYQLISQTMPGLTIVVSPLISLMKDQCESMTAVGIPAVRLDQSISGDAFAAAWRSIHDGTCRLLYLAPERFFNERFAAQLGSTPVSMLAIDEAHCMSQWGHSFRPDYQRLPELVHQYSIPQVLALTATAVPTVIKDIRKCFSIETKNVIKLSTHRSNLRLKRTIVATDRRDAVLLNRLGIVSKTSGGTTGARKKVRGSTLIYVTRRKTAEELAESLNEFGVDAMVYHAGLDPNQRDEVQQNFLRSKNAVLIGTIAFGMGVDKPDVRRVIHYNPSQSIEAYSQEIGRGGRDGKACDCETLLVPEDRITLGNLAAGDLPSPSSMAALIERLIGQPDRFYLAIGKLSYEINMSSESLARTMLRLQTMGYVTCLAMRYDTYRITPKLTRETIMSRASDSTRSTVDVVDAILSSLAKGKKGFRLNLAVASQRYAIPRERLIEVIESGGIAGWWNVQTADTMHGYEWTKRITRGKSLARSLCQDADRRYDETLDRIDDWMRLMQCRECMAISLASHFGHRRSRPCGRCSYCLESEATGRERPPTFVLLFGTDLSTDALESLGRSALGVLATAKQSYPDALGDPIDQAKFLCGLFSPSTGRFRMYKDSGYGACDHVPFRTVLAACRAASSTKTAR